MVMVVLVDMVVVEVVEMEVDVIVGVMMLMICIHCVGRILNTRQMSHLAPDKVAQTIIHLAPGSGADNEPLSSLI